MRTADKNDYSPTKIIPQLNYYKSAFCSSFVDYSPDLYSELEYCDFAINLFRNPAFFFTTLYSFVCSGTPTLGRTRPEATMKIGEHCWSEHILLMNSSNMNCSMYKAASKLEALEQMRCSNAQNTNKITV